MHTIVLGRFTLAFILYVLSFEVLDMMTLPCSCHFRRKYCTVLYCIVLYPLPLPAQRSIVSLASLTVLLSSLPLFRNLSVSLWTLLHSAGNHSRADGGGSGTNASTKSVNAILNVETQWHLSPPLPCIALPPIVRSGSGPPRKAHDASRERADASPGPGRDASALHG